MSNIIPENYDPFAIIKTNNYDFISRNDLSVSWNLVKGFWKNNPIAISESLIDGPAKALINGGMWKFIYFIIKLKLGIFIKEIINYAYSTGNYDRVINDYCCIAYGQAVSKALHNDEKKAVSSILKSLFGSTLQAERAKYFEIIPPMTTSLMHVLLLNLRALDLNFDDEAFDKNIHLYDLSSFEKLKTRIFRIDGIGDYCLPALYVDHNYSLRIYLNPIRNLSSNAEFFVDSIDHYEKKKDMVPDELIYGD